MGNEPSKNNGDNRPNAKQLTKRDVEALLDKQRRIYETRYQKLMTDKADNSLRSQGDQTSTYYAYAQPQASTSFATYPNLHNVNATSYSMNNPNNFPASSTRVNTTQKDGYVFIYSNQTQKSESLSSLAPAAPAPTVQADARARSTSRSRPTTRNNEDEELNCPTCSKKFGLNIYQCNSGHSSCKDCKLRNAPCGLCRQPITNMRNITLEAYVAEIKTPCVNAKEGCTWMFKQSDMEFHLKECPFKEMACPIVEIGYYCNWRGKRSQLLAHFKTTHPYHCQGDVDKEMVLPITEKFEEKYLHFVELGNFHFLVHLNLSKADKMIYMTVQLIGTEASANKWGYELHVYNKRHPRKKYQYEDTCHSSSIPVMEIFKKFNCATMPMQYVSNFINEYCITYKFYIKKHFEGNKKVFRKQRTRSTSKQSNN